MNRTQGYLNWRFIENTDDYKIFTIKQNNIYVGYYILKIGYWNGLKVGYIADYLFSKNIKKYNPHIINAIIEYFLKLNASMVSVWACVKSGFYKSLKGNLFFRHSNVPIIVYGNSLGAKIVNDDISCHFTYADTDNI